MKDWRETKIEVGSRVLYVSRQNSNMWVTEGEVVAISNGEVAVRRIRSSDPLRNQSSRTGKERIVYPSASRLTVIGDK